MMLAPDAVLNDGLLDVVLTDRATRFDVVKELPRIQRGGYLKNPKVSYFRSPSVLIQAYGEKTPAASRLAASWVEARRRARYLAPEGALQEGATLPKGAEATNEMRIDIDGEAAGFTPAMLTVLPRIIRFSGY
jgi:diacylglycerol kinase family enzyme